MTENLLTCYGSNGGIRWLTSEPRILSPEWVVNLKSIQNQSKFKQFLTKVKQMFWNKKRKEMESDIKALQERESAFRKWNFALENEVKILSKKAHDLEEGLDNVRTFNSGIRLLINHLVDFQATCSHSNVQDYEKNGYRFVGNYGKDDGFQMWIKDKKQPSKTKKSKSKKKR